MTQPNIDGTGHGIPRMLYASDGEHWYALKVRDSGILEVCSKSGDKIFGFESIVEEYLKNEDLNAGTNNLLGTPVSAGKIWKITCVSIRYVGTVPTLIGIDVPGLASTIPLLVQYAPISTMSYTWTGEVYLQVNDYLEGVVVGATLHDKLYARYAGVQMNAP